MDKEKFNMRKTISVRDDIRLYYDHTYNVGQEVVDWNGMAGVEYR